MRSLSELKIFYDTELADDVKLLEAERKKVAQKIFIGWFAIVLIDVIIFYKLASNKAAVNSPQGILFPLLVLFIVSVFLFLGIYYFFSRDYTIEFKSIIIKKLVSFIDPSLSYSANYCISKELYMMSRLFPRKVDRYCGDDMVSGKSGKTDILFSELHTEYKVRTTNSKGQIQTRWYTIFKGLFFIGDFNKDFKGTTVVLPDTAEKMFGSMGNLFQSWNLSRDELIKLEDPEFEKFFVVYGNDQIEARYILSTSLMKRIVDFKKKTNRNIHISFNSPKVFVAVSYRKSLFEPKIFTTLLDFTPIQEYFEDLQMAIGIVEDLNLNTRIWSKVK